MVGIAHQLGGINLEPRFMDQFAKAILQATIVRTPVSHVLLELIDITLASIIGIVSTRKGGFKLPHFVCVVNIW